MNFPSFDICTWYECKAAGTLIKKYVNMDIIECKKKMIKYDFYKTEYKWLREKMLRYVLK